MRPAAQLGAQLVKGRAPRDVAVEAGLYQHGEGKGEFPHDPSNVAVQERCGVHRLLQLGAHLLELRQVLGRRALVALAVRQERLHDEDAKGVHVVGP